MAEEKILIVEDHDFMRQLLASRLKASGYDVIMGADGNEGLNKALQEKPDLIILDINLPGISGLKLGAMLKADPQTKSIPIIFVSARGEGEDVFKAISQIGAECYILKPFTSEKLVEEIKKALNKYKT
jgi:DNA-binding response OmpR family regulator